MLIALPFTQYVVPITNNIVFNVNILNQHLNIGTAFNIALFSIAPIQIVNFGFNFYSFIMTNFGISYNYDFSHKMQFIQIQGQLASWIKSNYILKNLNFYFQIVFHPISILKISFYFHADQEKFTYYMTLGLFNLFLIEIITKYLSIILINWLKYKYVNNSNLDNQNHGSWYGLTKDAIFIILLNS